MNEAPAAPREGDEPPPFEMEDLLWLIEEMPTAASTLLELKGDLEYREIAVADALLARLIRQGIREGLVAAWKGPGGVRFTLTPLSADRLGVRMSTPIDAGSIVAAILDPELTDPIGSGMHGLFFLPREKELTEKVKRAPFEDRTERDFDALIDPRLPEPLDVLAGLDGSRYCELRDGSRVKMHMILGLGLPWPEALTPAVVEGRSICRGCKNDLHAERPRLGRTAFCAICERSGADGKFPPIEPELVQKPGRKSYRKGALEGGKGPPGPVLRSGQRGARSQVA